MEGYIVHPDIDKIIWNYYHMLQGRLVETHVRKYNGCEVTVYNFIHTHGRQLIHKTRHFITKYTLPINPLFRVNETYDRYRRDCKVTDCDKCGHKFCVAEWTEGERFGNRRRCCHICEIKVITKDMEYTKPNTKESVNYTRQYFRQNGGIIIYDNFNNGIVRPNSNHNLQCIR